MNKELLNCERVWLNVTPATLRPDLADYGLLEPHALGVHEGRIHALVPMQDLKGIKPGDEVVLFGRQGDAEVKQSDLEEYNGALLADMYTVWGYTNPKKIKR